MDEIFVEKNPRQIPRYSCDHTYRDILVFKKNKKVVGIAKICFECDGYHIVGALANTNYFGVEDGFKKLKKILRHNFKEVKKTKKQHEI